MVPDRGLLTIGLDGATGQVIPNPHKFASEPLSRAGPLPN